MKNVLFIGQLTDISGYGNASRCYLSNLISLHNDKKINLSVLNFSFETKIQISKKEIEKIKLFSITDDINAKRGQYDVEDMKKISSFTESEYEVIFFLLNDWMASGSTIDHLFHNNAVNLNYICKKSKKIHPCVVWESDTAPDIWIKSYKNLNIGKLICACDWNKKSFEKHYDSVVIPYSINFQNDYDVEYYDKISKIVKDKFVFCSVFQWSERKGVEKMITSYYLEFHDNPNVSMILKTYINKAMSQRDEVAYLSNEIKKIKNKIFHNGREIDPKCKVVIINDILDKKRVNSIYKASNVYVSCTKGEGFGLPIAEAINYDLSVVVPSIGGHLDYIDKNNNFIIDSTLEPCVGYKNPYWSSLKTNWVEVSVSSTKEKMRAAFSENTNKKKSKEYMHNALSSKLCENKFLEVLS
tara:strand:+ start:362 stop:1600 length:1239 start_codon:yes stop_codon:yes gene_type:complete